MHHFLHEAVMFYYFIYKLVRLVTLANLVITSVHKEPSHKVSKERLTLPLRGNAAGNFKLKALLVYQAENLRALKFILKSQLLVIWKAWVTLAVFRTILSTILCLVLHQKRVSPLKCC